MRQQDIGTPSYMKTPHVKEMDRLSAIIPRQVVIDTFGAMIGFQAAHFREKVATFAASYPVSAEVVEPYVFAVLQEYWKSLPDDFWEDT